MNMMISYQELVRTFPSTNVIFNQYMPFATYIPGRPSTVTHNYIAELTQNPSVSVKDGPFSKDVIIKINYQ